MFTNQRCRRTLLAIPVVLLLASAAPAQAGEIPTSPWSHLWVWLSSWTGFSLDSGPGIDPHGGNGASAPSSSTDVGPVIDPDGRNGALTPPSSSTDSGSRIDPNGGNT